jgi:hypothetical protein
MSDMKIVFGFVFILLVGCSKARDGRSTEADRLVLLLSENVLAAAADYMASGYYALAPDVKKPLLGLHESIAGRLERHLARILFIRKAGGLSRKSLTNIASVLATTHGVLGKR